jgi:hypothetical protein
MARTSAADLTAAAVAAFERALESLGHRAAGAPSQSQADLVVEVDGMPILIELKAASVVDPGTVERALASKPGAGTTCVLVGDLITAPARKLLGEAGWGWLDRRGHVLLRAPGVHIDADVPPDARPAAGPAPSPISGSAGISWAVALLQSPDDPPSMRQVARDASFSHTAIVATAKRLRESSLVRADGRPLVPELFWALADVWQPRTVALAATPAQETGEGYGSLGVNPEGDEPGWAVAGTLGAAAWGAPVAVGGDYPPDFYVPSAAAMRQAVLRLGEATRFEERACTVAVAPTPLVCTGRFERPGGPAHRWPLAHGLFAALDLARDEARGPEILEGWNPEDFTRVW